MGRNVKFEYSVDLVFCIDATMSMDHILDLVKKNALNLYGDLMDKMDAKGKHVDSVRVRIVAFRDYYYDGDKAMMVTDFFNLPEQAAEFRDCVESIVADGGGDDPEDGLEALAYAMRSDWCRDHKKHRHVIVVWSDDDAHDLGFGKSAPNYPQGMAKNFDELTEWWGFKGCEGVMDEQAKRLLLFAPSRTENTECTNWARISDNWNKVIQHESDAGSGLNNVDYQVILDAIVNTV